MMNKTFKILVLGMCMLMTFSLIAGCESKVSVPDMSSMGTIDVVSREEGSGTKTEFEALVGTDASGTNKIAASTDEVKQVVSEEKDAIGYIAYSALNNDSNIKLLDVDGINPDGETIKKGKYPLCRDYVLVYTGSLSGAAQDFLSYVKSEGQDIVAEYCTPVKKSGTFLSDKSSGNITIHGSTSAAPIVRKLAEGYMKANPNAKIEITESDSTQGLNDAMQGKCDFGMSSRSLKSYEKELLTGVVFGRDAIAVIVNTENPMEDISTDILKNIYDNKYEKWSDIK